MSKKVIDDIIGMTRKIGTEKALNAILDPSRQGGVEKMAMRQAQILIKLISILEFRHYLRRGHIVSMICSAEGIKETHEDK